MAAIESGVYSLLAGATTVTALVGTRITPDRRTPGAALPALVYEIGLGEPFQNLSGSHGGMTRTTIDITAIATSKLSARAIINACALALDGYSGETGGVTIRGLNLDSLSTAYYEPSAGEGLGVYAATLTVRAMHATI